jgi:hypothetical protein
MRYAIGKRRRERNDIDTVHYAGREGVGFIRLGELLENYRQPHDETKSEEEVN